MANSKYDYVRQFERPDILLPNTYIIIRIDGRGFHQLAKKYDFQKPNGQRALSLMNAAAEAVNEDLPDIKLAYGFSDEYSFILDRSCRLFDRRESKILTIIVSTFTAYYMSLWSSYFPEKALSAPMPSFDGRALVFPTSQNLRDYMAWRQVDCHINNLYNTTFWALVLQGYLEAAEAEEQLKGTIAAVKNEILFSHFQINYNNEPDIFKRGSVIYRDYRTRETAKSEVLPAERPVDDVREVSRTQREECKRQSKSSIVVEHCDIIKDKFWESKPWLLRYE